MTSLGEYARTLLSRVMELDQKRQLAVDPVLKEMRCNPTKPGILISDRIIFLYHYLQSAAGESIDVYNNWFPTQNENVIRDRLFTIALFEVAFSLLDEEWSTRLVYPRVSTRTFIDGQTMRDSIRRTMRAASAGHSVVSFTHWLTCINYGGPISSFERSTQLHTWDFYRDLISLVERCHSERRRITEDDVTKFCHPYDRPTNLELKEKYYYERGDKRAYYVDKSMPRSLTGSILQVFLNQRNLKNSWRSFASSVKPIRGGNLANYAWRDVREGLILMVAVGDIQSFSASNTEAWTSLIMMAQSLSLDGLEHLDNPFIIDIEGTSMEITLSQVIRCYLYETVFASAYIHDHGIHRTFGGYLGVTGNMALITLCLAIRLKLFARDHANLRPYVRVGGDDFLVCLLGDTTAVHIAFSQIASTIDLEIGPLKELQSLLLHPAEALDETTTFLYCKKHLRIQSSHTSDGLSINVQSIHQLPIMSQLVEKPPTDSIELNRWFSSYVSGCLDVCSKLDCIHECYSFMIHLLFRRHHDLSVAWPSRAQGFAWTGLVTEREYGFASDKAHDIIERTTYVYDSLGLQYRTEWKDKVRLNIVKKRVVPVQIPSINRPAYVCQHELRHLAPLLRVPYPSPVNVGCNVEAQSVVDLLRLAE